MVVPANTAAQASPSDGVSVRGSGERFHALLGRSVEFSRWRMEPFRRNRLKMVREMVGRNFSNDGAGDRVPINMLELAVNVYTHQLIAKTPKSYVSTRIADLIPMALEFETRINNVILEMRLEKTLRQAVVESMFGPGLVKVGLTHGNAAEMYGEWHDAGIPFMDVISLDDWVHDMTATSWERMGFVGNRYRVPLEQAKEVFGTDKLTAMDQHPYNEQGDTRTETIQRGEEVYYPENFRDMVDLWDIYIPRDKRMLTFQAGFSTEGGLGNWNEPISDTEWDGPEEGPYRMLGYNYVPDSVFPLSPMSLILDLHELANQLFRKLGRQSERQKSILGARGAAMEDGNRILKASDGDVVLMEDPKSVQEFKFGGPDNINLAFLLQVKDLFAYFGGNIDALGGLSPQADTLGQEKLLNEQASQRIAGMQDCVLDFTRGIVNTIGWYEWTDPVREQMLEKEIGGRKMDFLWSPETREGDFLQYDINIEPYSLKGKTPAARLQMIQQVMQNIVMPMMPQMEAQGIGVNLQKLMSNISKLGDAPELADILDVSLPIQPTAPSAPTTTPSRGKNATGNQQTTRSYVRRNIPGGSRSGSDTALASILAGGGAQQSNAESIGRPKG